MAAVARVSQMQRMGWSGLAQPCAAQTAEAVVGAGSAGSARLVAMAEQGGAYAPVREATRVVRRALGRGAGSSPRLGSSRLEITPGFSSASSAAGPASVDHDAAVRLDARGARTSPSSSEAIVAVVGALQTQLPNLVHQVQSAAIESMAFSMIKIALKPLRDDDDS